MKKKQTTRSIIYRIFYTAWTDRPPFWAKTRTRISAKSDAEALSKFEEFKKKSERCRDFQLEKKQIDTVYGKTKVHICETTILAGKEKRQMPRTPRMPTRAPKASKEFIKRLKNGMKTLADKDDIKRMKKVIALLESEDLHMESNITFEQALRNARKLNLKRW